MKKWIFIVGVLFASEVLVAQEVENDYTTEVTWGVNKNTNGGLIGGVIFKLSRQQRENLFVMYGLEMMNVRHPKEQRYLSQASGTSFTWGKENFLYAIRGIYGREHLLFKKAPKQGVQIGLLYGAGPTLGIIAPYYILYGGEYVHFNHLEHNNFSSVQGSGKLFQGLGDSQLTFGLNAKAGLSFEFGTFKNNVAGVETGIALEAFPKEIILVPTQENNALFTSLYFSLYWGTRK